MPTAGLSLARRTKALITLVFLLGAVIIVRLFYIQVVMHGYYENEALKEHIGKFVIQAKRGEIYAKDGSKTVPLVLNEPSYTVYADARYVKDIPKTADTLRRIA